MSSYPNPVDNSNNYVQTNQERNVHGHSEKNAVSGTTTNSTVTNIDRSKTTFGELEKLFENTQIAMVAGLDSNMSLGNGNPIGYLFGMKSWRKRNVGHVTLSMLGRFPNDVQGIVNTEWAMGFFFAVRRSLICQWNLRFDEQLTSYAYAEDLDFTYTYFKYARAHGLRCVFCSKIIVDHLGSKEYRVPSQKTCYMYVINREYLSYKHNKSWRSRLATRWANIGMVVMNIRNPQRLKYYWQAQICCDRNRKSLKLGVMPDDIYEAI